MRAGPILFQTQLSIFHWSPTFCQIKTYFALSVFGALEPPRGSGSCRPNFRLSVPTARQTLSFRAFTLMESNETP